MTRASLSAVAVLLASLPLSPARADVEDYLGLGAEAAAMGNAVVAVPVGYASAHYDPAMLAVSRRDPQHADRRFTELTIGFSYARPVVHATRFDGMALDARAPDASILGLGVRFDLGQLFGIEGLVCGLALSTPVTYLFRYHARPDDQPSWLALTDANLHLSITVGLAWRPLEWLALGAGVRTTFASELYTTASVRTVDTPIDPETGEPVIDVGTRLGESGGVYGRVLPIVGIAVMPIPELSIGLVWRASTLVDDWGWSRVQAVPSIGDLGYVHRFAHYFRPHEVVLGVAVTPVRELSFSVDLGWEHWADAISPAYAELGGRFGDILVPAIGVRASPLPWLELLAGWRFVRAPFRNFGGPTNLLVNDTHHASIGTAIDVRSLVPDLGFGAVLRASFRLAILDEHRETKDWRRFESDGQLALDPGNPGYVFGGFVPSFQLSFEARW